jgi:DNA recombination protein RmuC
MELTLVFVFIFGCLLGFAGAWNLAKRSKKTIHTPEIIEKQLIENISLKKDVQYLQNQIDKSENKLSDQKNKEINQNIEINDLTIKLTELNIQNNNLEEKLKNRSNEITSIQEKFTQEFKLIANSILKQNSEDFSKVHQKGLSEILFPLKEKISSFESSVEKKYLDETKERSALKQEIKQLVELNNTLNIQAKNLTSALKGDNKTQGNWGEMVLERILESSGLIKGKEYETQFSDTNVENKRILPDIIIKLPDDKHIIIDSKVSLVAYEKYSNSEIEQNRLVNLKNHVLSIKSHVKKLSEKNYQTGIEVNSPDFVLLFIPIESSFSAAVQGDQNLYSYAWDKKVVIVSPTTLLATLRTIASVWKHERQTKNAIEIADKAGRLYDKFKSFIDDMQKIDRGISASRTAYNDAFNKLKLGTGNLIKRAEDIKELGANTSKSISHKLITESDNE